LKEEDDGVFFFSRIEKKKHRGKKNHKEEKKMQRREGTYLSSFDFAFLLPSPRHVPSKLSSPPSFKPCVSHLLEVLGYSSFRNGVSKK
jgi:hypothetical protein